MAQQYPDLVNEALDDGDETCQDGIEPEKDVVDFDRDDLGSVLGHVLLLDGSHPVHAHVVKAVQGEADHVQRQEVEVQTNHTGKKMVCKKLNLVCSGTEIFFQ